jgi:hypothetical protein
MNPEWIEPGDGMGRQIDLTGMRLSAQSSEDRLLDGITTITPRLRYLTFRAWIISRYWHGRQPDRWKTFIEFAARQEAALALGLAANDYRGTTIVGISEARKLVDGGKSAASARIQPVLRRSFPSSPLADRWCLQRRESYSSVLLASGGIL